MGVALDAAASFLVTNARVLDRRRSELLVDEGEEPAVLAALDAYRNQDGGYGHGLEPDLRARESQPVAAMHAFEVLVEVGPSGGHEAIELANWLNTVTLADGGLPFALPVEDPTGCAPFWVGADPSESSLHISTAVAAHAHRASLSFTELYHHPWLERCTRYCLDTIAAVSEPAHALELMYCLRFLDAVHEREPRAADLLQRLTRHIPPSGTLHVAGGLPDEMLHPLDFAPEPESSVRDVFAPGVVEADLDRVEAGQSDDGGWPLGWKAYSPAAALEWRGYVTVEALRLSKINGRL